MHCPNNDTHNIYVYICVYICIYTLLADSCVYMPVRILRIKERHGLSRIEARLYERID